MHQDDDEDEENEDHDERISTEAIDHLAKGLVSFADVDISNASLWDVERDQHRNPFFFYSSRYIQPLLRECQATINSLKYHVEDKKNKPTAAATIKKTDRTLKRIEAAKDVFSQLMTDANEVARANEPLVFNITGENENIAKDMKLFYKAQEKVTKRPESMKEEINQNPYYAG